ncbi:hypothetical protein AGABI2DRAFT_117040 [Agaricus bisporus var. bisporus H97]|uniref:hypothetical protein n=1 Tax=Agaricus bisporus var. bisporus (strain H97 / ATCC MYA-4626 / FGSC 10389) TaxID=936046 RepID=UPI00029F57A2|nr:hypothetical protein AGABI2DRAFT_117040 [Agaricus bisporus var. bisporus H97]EKV48217.1 hypothetical protein AGABI2DRAFT_117040 [Agaricus bisporus var. bisporus H97]
MHDQKITDRARPSETSQTSKTMLIETTAQDSETDKKSQRKRKRRKSQNNSSGETTVANTRENSEERENDGDVGNEFPKRRPVRRKHGDVITGEDCEGSKSATLTQNEPSTSDNPNIDGLYIEDINPAPLPSNIVIPPPPIHNNNQSLSDDNSEQTKLLLPAHVSVLGSTPVEILPDESDEDDKDYIKYLDYEVDRHEFLRYFEEPEDESIKLKRTVCKNCGAEGDHKTADCRVLICLTCGARDEHVTKSCPVSKVCFSCGMKGHININCPNRHLNRARNHESLDYCKRCSSELHQTTECPTWWRLYVYVADDDRTQTLDERRSKRDLGLGKGGEGYIAEDEWCYNCGEAGHWGDDCEGSKRYDKPDEPSAFGLYNVSKGPFYNPKELGATIQHERRLRDWEHDDRRFGDWGKYAPDNVGRQGRKKMMERMRKNAKIFEEESDPEDWFRGAKNRIAPPIPTQPRLARKGREDRQMDRERQKDKDRNGEREQRDNDKDRYRRRGTYQDRESDRRRGMDNRDRGKGRDRDLGRESHRERDRDGDRDRDREGERGKSQERNGTRDEGLRRHPNDSSKVKIKLPQTSAGKTSLHPGLPPRPPAQSQPTLLARLSDPVPESPSLSIKGAGKKRNRDDRRSYQPQYRGGYGS